MQSGWDIANAADAAGANFNTSTNPFLIKNKQFFITGEFTYEGKKNILFDSSDISATRYRENPKVAPATTPSLLNTPAELGIAADI